MTPRVAGEEEELWNETSMERALSPPRHSSSSYPAASPPQRNWVRKRKVEKDEEEEEEEDEDEDEEEEEE